MPILQRISDSLFGQPTKISLPIYVQQAIKQQQNSSEKLVSWVLLLIVIIFGILYFVSPKTFSYSMAQFAPVPWALLTYFVFSLIRLGLSYKTYLPNWFLMLSIITDISLLLILIWSFHLQYEQPASFYLKAPTLLYMFIFIALRTLHFEAKYVLTAGIVSALGWLTLLGYALTTSPTGTITRNYVLYMTSNHILIGGEIDKIISILMVTGILTIAIIRAQRLLTQSVTETLSTQGLSKFFIPEIAAEIIKSGQDIKPGYGELRKVAILHCDIRGFTLITQQYSPKEVMQILTEYQSKIIQVIQRHQGSVDKFIGDGVLVSFNAIQPSENYAANALYAALEIASVMSNWAAERKLAHLPPIHIGISIASGTAMLGIVGDATRMEYTVIGDPVNLAAKLDKQCKIENCIALSTEAAFILGKNQGFISKNNIEIRRDRVVEGISEKINLAILVR